MSLLVSYAFLSFPQKRHLGLSEQVGEREEKKVEIVVDVKKIR